MAGTVPHGELEVCGLPPAAPLRTRVRFALAGEADDAGIRRLLRDNPMQGEVSLAFEREPDYFRSCGQAGAEDQTIIAAENSRLVCVGRSSVRIRFLNGRPRRVGYLSELRLDAAVQGRFDVVRRGYQFFRDLQRVNPPDLWFTSIAEDNHRSIRFLERNLRGMPRYEFLHRFVTLLISVPKRSARERRLAPLLPGRLQASGIQCEAGSPAMAASMALLLNEYGQQFQFATEWTGARLQGLERWGLPLDHWLCLSRGSNLLACAALWDQRSFRQTVIRGYGWKTAASRPFVNLAASVLGVAGMPAVGSTLAHGFLSPLAVAAGEEDLLPALADLSLAGARQRGLDFLTLGFPESHSGLHRWQRRLRGRVYRSRLYRVEWPEPGKECPLDGRPVAPEVALL